MTDREVKATIGVELDEASFVRLKAQINKENEQIKAQMKKAMADAGLKIDDKYIRQFTNEFIAAKQKETQAAQKAANDQEKAAQKFENDIAKINAKITSDKDKELQKQVRAARTAADDLLKEQKRENAKQEAEEARHDNKLAALKRRVQQGSAGVFGGYRGRRAFDAFDAAAGIAAENGNAGSLPEIAGIMIGLEAPMIGLSVAGKALMEVFDFMRQAGKDASAALFEIGGGKNLQQTMVAAANNEMAAAKIAGQSNSSTGQISNIMTNIRDRFPLKDESINALLSSYSQKSGGDLSNMPTETMAKLALTNDPSEVGAFAGHMKLVDKNATENQLSDLLIQAKFAKDRYDVDVFSNPDMMDQLRPRGGVGFIKNLDILASTRRGGGARMRQGIKEVVNYEQSDPNLSHLAAAAAAAGDSDAAKNTVPGAIRADAKEQLGDKFTGNQKQLQEFIDHLQDGSEAFVQFNKETHAITDTQQAHLEVLQNQLQDQTTAQLKQAGKDLTQAEIDNAKDINTAGNTIKYIGMELERVGVGIKGFLARTFSDYITFTPKPGDEVPDNKLDPKKDAIDSKEKDITKIEHAKSTADNTAALLLETKNSAIQYKRMADGIERLSLKVNPPTSKPQ